MIQRIQSVFLLLAGLAFLGSGFFKDVLTEETMAWLMPTVVGLNALVAIGALVNVFLYNDRKKQLQIASMLQYLAIVAILAAFGGLYLTGRLAEASSNPAAMALVGLPVLGYVFIRLATMRIKKDIELVRSMDRLR